MRLVVLTAPSGSGKTTIARHLLQAIPGMHFSVSATTRPARRGEQHGVDYFFLSREQFEHMREAGEFVEFEEVYPGLFYGTLKREIESGTAEEPILLDIDVKGALNIKQAYGNDVYVVYIKTPTLEELKTRLEQRATESAHSVGERLRRAKEELKFEHRFDHVIINDKLEDAVSETIEQVSAFLSAPSKNSAGEHPESRL